MNRAQLMTSAAILRSPEEPAAASPPQSLDQLGREGATSSEGPIGLDTTNPPDVAPEEVAPEAVKPEGLSDEDWTLLQETKKAKEAPQEEAAKDEPSAEVPFELPHADKTDAEITALLTEQGGFAADPKYLPAAIEFERTGTVSEATLKATAEGFGIPLEMAQQFVDGQKALRTAAVPQAESDQAAIVQDIHGAVGGTEAYTAIQGWALEAAKGSPEVKALVEDYNAALDVSPRVAKNVLAQINAAYKADGNGAPRDVTREALGGPRTGNGPQPYASDAEMHADMAKREYNEDPAFRTKVEARVKAGM